MTPEEREEIAGLLKDAHASIAELHALLPDDGKEQGLAPSWWEAGTRANIVRVAIDKYLKANGATP